MASFAALTKRVHSINELILSDMISVKKDYNEELVEFRDRLLVTINWFSKISWANKKRFVLALLDDVRSVWTLSMLLKSIWNCRPKDAVISVCQPQMWSSYDQVPMDHNRTALPLSTLKLVMTKDRIWFLSLEPECQAIILSELLLISGGPIMWEVLERAQTLYETYLEHELKDLRECNVISEAVPAKPAPEPAKKENTPRPTKDNQSMGQMESAKLGQAQKELEANLTAWNAYIKSMRDRMKLEELEMVFGDGSKKKVWKVNRPKPEAVETVDFVQLLPSEIGKRILLYLPVTQLSDCARVNKYWSYLVDELKSELSARQKINIELQKLKDNMLRHDESLELLAQPEFQLYGDSSPDMSESSKKTKTEASGRLSVKSKTKAPSFRQIVRRGNFRKPPKPINNLLELSERMQRRGAADENLWKWCENVLADIGHTCEEQCTEGEGLMPLETSRFPHPLMKHIVNVPLKLPLMKDPVESATVKTAVNMARGNDQNDRDRQDKRYSLWSRDMSGLYPVRKLPSYQFPF